MEKKNVVRDIVHNELFFGDDTLTCKKKESSTK